MKAFTLILLLVIAYAVASPAAVNKNAKKKLYESLKDESTDEVPCEEDTLEEVVKPIKEKDIIIKDKAIADSRDKEDEIPSVSAGGKCGPEHGRCSNNECCSLAKECGRTTAHCNVSLGCRRKFGVCH